MDQYVVEDQRWVDVQGVNDAALMPADSYCAHRPAINDHTFTKSFMGGVVHANVGQKLLICNKIKSFPDVRR
jgi:hypothetical protein